MLNVYTSRHPTPGAALAQIATPVLVAVGGQDTGNASVGALAVPSLPSGGGC
jgi:hypothetical protein